MESIQLTGNQQEKLAHLREIITSAQTALDIMNFPNDFNDSPFKVDGTIALAVRRIESHLNRLKSLPPVRLS